MSPVASLDEVRLIETKQRSRGKTIAALVITPVALFALSTIALMIGAGLAGPQS